MGCTVWHFLEDLDGSLVRIPAARARAFLGGEGRLETAGRSELRFLDVMLEVDRRVARAFLRAWPVLRRVTPEGALDRDHVRDAVRTALQSADLLAFLEDRGENVVGIEPHLARQHIEAAHRWKPTNGQLQQVLNAIHRAAADPPLAVISADCRLLAV